MTPLILDDPRDPRLADYRQLNDRPLARRSEDPVFVAEGILVIRQLLRSCYPIRSLLLTEPTLGRMESDLEALPAGVPVYLAPPEVMQSVAGFPFHRGALAAAARRPLPSATEVLAGARLVLILEAINDHENLGALFRNAAAFGVDAVLLCPRCADPLYRRSVRVSMGHILRLPFARLEPWPEALATLTERGIRLVALTPAPTAVPVDRLAAVGGTTAVLVGAEGGGLSARALAAATVAVRIPMARSVDSLNVATAAAVALHRLTYHQDLETGR